MRQVLAPGQSHFIAQLPRKPHQLCTVIISLRKTPHNSQHRDIALMIGTIKTGYGCHSCINSGVNFLAYHAWNIRNQSESTYCWNSTIITLYHITVCPIQMIRQTYISDVLYDVLSVCFIFSLMKMYEFWLKFHWSLYLSVNLTIFPHCLR